MHSIVSATFVMCMENKAKKSYGAAASGPCCVTSPGLEHKELISVQCCVQVLLVVSSFNVLCSSVLRGRWRSGCTFDSLISQFSFFDCGTLPVAPRRVCPAHQ